MAQTAVEQFWDEIAEILQFEESETVDKLNEAYQQAKQMEREQRINAQMDMFHHINRRDYGLDYLNRRDAALKYAEDYYTQTYNQNK